MPTPDVENDAKGDCRARVFFQPFLNSDNFALRGSGFGVAGTYVDSTGSATNHAAAVVSHAGPADVLQLPRQRCGTGTTPAVNAHVRGWRAHALVAAVLLLLQQLRRARRVRGGLAGRHAAWTARSTRSDTLDNKAWQLQFTWLLTGEEEGFRGIDAGHELRGRQARAAAPGSWWRACTS